MLRRHPLLKTWLPKLWLLTDERQGDLLWPALARLPRGSGVIVRHYRLSADQRRRLFDRVRSIARARRLVVILSGDSAQASAWRADGSYGNHRNRHRHDAIRLAPVHNLPEIRAAERDGANLLLLSPLFATRSHPGASFLGMLKFAALIRATRLPTIALGGVKPHNAPLLAQIGAYGWAAIDAFVAGKPSNRY